MGLKVKLHSRARADLKAIHDYLRRHASLTAADRGRVHLRQRVMQLASTPNIGTLTSEPEIRILAPTRYPYRIYYTLAAGKVLILHIRHTARRGPASGELG